MITTRLDLALRFAAEGFRLFPQARNKIPCIKGWPDKASDDPEQIQKWARQFPKCNFAVATGQGSGVLVLDIDIKNEQPGRDSLGRMQEDIGDLPTTLVARTGSGGGHIYLRIPPGVQLRNGPLPEYPGIELKAEGACATLPGSTYADGREYTITQDNPIAECPQALLKILQMNRGKHELQGGNGNGGRISVGGRNLALTSLAGSMREKGIDPEAILAALRVHNKNRCNPPLSDEEVQSIAQSVSRYRPKGNDDPTKPITNPLLDLFKPQKLNELLTEIDNESRLGDFHALFFGNPELGYQLAAAFLYHELAGDDGRLVRVGNVVHIYTERGYFWQPLLDVTRPDAPFNEIDYLSGNQRVVDLFGPDFLFVNPRNGRVYRKHFNKIKVSDTRAFFVSYLTIHVPINEDLLLHRPGKTVSTADGLLIFDGEGYRIEPHRPDHGQTLPAFPFRYRPWEKVPDSEQTTLFTYLTNLARAVPQDQTVKMVEMLGFLTGYTLTPYRAKFFLVLIGEGDTGKTTWLELLQALHGSTGTFVEVDFVQMERQPNQFDNASFIGALLAMQDDFTPAGRLPSQKLKGLANPSKPMTVNQKFKPPVTIINRAAPFLSTNALPQSDDPYLANRLLCVPFLSLFTATEQVASETIELIRTMHTPEMLQTLFDFGVHCLQRFFKEDTIRGYIPTVVSECTARVAGRLNDVQAWLQEALESEILRETPDGRAGRTRLYRAYEAARKNPILRANFYTTMRRKYGDEVMIVGIEHFRGLEFIDHGGRDE